MANTPVPFDSTPPRNLAARRFWAVTFLVINVAGFGMAIAMRDFWHAMSHVGLGVASWLWLQSINQASAAVVTSGKRDQIEERLQVLELEVTQLHDHLVETQERLDFAERMLAQLPEQKRVN